MKKVISVLVALMMLISVFSVSAFAAVNDAVLAIRVTPTATSYTPGEVVTFEVSYEQTSEIGQVGACTLHLGYDSSVFEPVDTLGDGLTMDTAGFQTVVLTGYALEGKVSEANSFVQSKGALDAADTAKGWNASLKIALTGTGVLFDASSEVKVLAFKLRVKQDAANGNYTVGVTKGSVDDYSTQVDEEISPISGPSGADYEFSVSKIFDLYDASVTVEGGNGGGTTPPADETTAAVEHDTTDTLKNTKVRWATTEEDSRNNVLYVGFEGKLTGVSADKVSTIKEIGFRFSTSDATLKEATNVKTFVIYDFTSDGTGYKFRSIVRRPLAKADIDGTVTHNIYAQAYVIVDGTTTPITASDIISTTLKAEYAQGVAQGMEDRFAQ